MPRKRSAPREFWRNANPGQRTVTRKTLKRQHENAEPYRPVEGREHEPVRAPWRARRPGSLPWENGAR
jgi:hypothetical protein